MSGVTSESVFLPFLSFLAANSKQKSKLPKLLRWVCIIDLLFGGSAEFPSQFLQSPLFLFWVETEITFSKVSLLLGFSASFLLLTLPEIYNQIEQYIDFE
jgi:hypothetical protein